MMLRFKPGSWRQAGLNMYREAFMIFKKWALILAAFLLWGLPGPSWASTDSKRPMETIREPINQIIAVLNDPAYHSPGKKELQRDRIWEIARPMFDFDEISRRAIGKSWDTFTPDEKKRFTSIFSEFLGNTYIDKLQGEYHNEKIDFERELVKGAKALVRTKLLRESATIPIDYRMKQSDGAWKVYDILVENGVSIVKNYYVQFNSMLRENTPAQLIERLEKKLDHHN
jgi:phospholipid transport system substrate-binding protein